VICDSCGTENPPGARFCVNPQCQAYLAWSQLDTGSPSGQPPTLTPAPGDPSASAAVKPGSLHPAGSNRPPRPDFTPEVTAPHAEAVSLTAAPIRPARLVEPAAGKTAIEPPLPPIAHRPPRYEFIRETPAPIAVKPIDEVASEPPPGDAVASGKHGLWFALDQHVVAVDPGRGVSVGAQVVNKGTVVEGVDVRVLGVPEDWVRIEPRRVNLDVGGRATLAIHLAPPKASDTRPGRAEVEVAVWSVVSPKVRCAEHLRVDVGTYHDLQVEHVPGELTVRRAGEFSLGLRNNGNDPMGVEAQARPGSSAAEKVVMKFEPRRVTIPAGGQSSVTVRARAVKRLFAGSPVTHDLQIDLLPDGPARPVEVKMVQRPLLPRWAPRVLALVVLLLLLGVGLGVWSWYKHRPQPVPSVLNQPVDLAVANLSKAGFKGVPINAPSATVAQGIVFRQNPGAGVHRHPGTVIAITVSSGAPRVTVGELGQLTEQQAVATLKQHGLKAWVVFAPSANVPTGRVTGQAPVPTAAVPAGTTVQITVSSGAKAPPQPTTGRSHT
jgi:hypothetical protein